MSEEALYRAAHPSVFIVEEMAARGWDLDVLAWLMVLGVSTREDALAALAPSGSEAEAAQIKAWHIERLALDLYCEVGPSDPRIRLFDMAQKFSATFGASADLFTNLEAAWLKDQDQPL